MSSIIDNTNTQIDERLSVLISNTSAVRAIAGAIENTLGPKGLDTMLVDAAGNIIVTNAGVTILDSMEANHPAARILINIARNQHKQAGDGTTTATIVASALITEGLAQITKGIPAGKIIDGINLAIKEALSLLTLKSRTTENLEDPFLKRAVHIAAREEEEITESIIKLAQIIGPERLKERGFKLSNNIISHTGFPSEIFDGVILKKRRANEQMPRKLENSAVLILDDALMPEEICDSALKTDAGFNASVTMQENFRKHITKLVPLGVKIIGVSRGIDGFAEDFLTANGITAVIRLSAKSLTAFADLAGAKPARRSILQQRPEEIKKYLGFIKQYEEREDIGHIRLSGGHGKNLATFIAGGSAPEISAEKERIASDAASSLQSALKEGIVAGGGAFELGIIPHLRKLRDRIKNLTSYGVDCVIEALKRPMSQIVTNAGFNSLEKVELVLRTLDEKDGSWGIDCETGELCDMEQIGIYDPAAVKRHALSAAGEAAQAILRINTMIRMRASE